MKTNTNEVAINLIEWINSITEYWETNAEYQTEKSKFEKNKASLDYT